MISEPPEAEVGEAPPASNSSNREPRAALKEAPEPKALPPALPPEPIPAQPAR